MREEGDGIVCSYSHLGSCMNYATIAVCGKKFVADLLLALKLKEISIQELKRVF